VKAWDPEMAMGMVRQTVAAVAAQRGLGGNSVYNGPVFQAFDKALAGAFIAESMQGVASICVAYRTHPASLPTMPAPRQRKLL
jgi:hypothetical protein